MSVLERWALLEWNRSVWSFRGTQFFMKRCTLPFGLRGLGKYTKQESVTFSSRAMPTVTPLVTDGGTPIICTNCQITARNFSSKQATAHVYPKISSNSSTDLKFFSGLDVRDANWRIPLHDKPSKLTAINIPLGSFRCNIFNLWLGVFLAAFQNNEYYHFQFGRYFCLSRLHRCICSRQGSITWGTSRP